MPQSLRSELKSTLIFIGLIWAVFLLDVVLPVNLLHLGLLPRSLTGLIGIPAMPFLHGNLGHLISNTVPLFVLLMLLAGSRARNWEIVGELVLLGGILLWVFGRPAIHVGASTLIFGLAVFLVVSGFRERRPLALLIAVLVLFFYGGSILAGILPRIGSPVSWDGHLAGAVAGGLVGYSLTRQRRRPDPS